jgi:hypothetical protein
MSHPKLKMADLYRDGMPLVALHTFVGEKLMDHHLPELAKHMEAEGVTLPMYSIKWFVTGKRFYAIAVVPTTDFAVDVSVVFSCSFQFDLVTRIWDLFLLQGWKVVYRIMLAILKLNETVLLAMSFEGIMTHMRDIHTTATPDQVMKKAATFSKANTKEIDGLIADFHKQQ